MRQPLPQSLVHFRYPSLGFPGQEFLENAQQNHTSEAEIEALIQQMRHIGRVEGLDKVFADYNINVLLGPADGAMTTFAAAAGLYHSAPAWPTLRLTVPGYPIASLPFGYVDSIGRPFGLAAIAPGDGDALLIQLMSAWEASFPRRKLPLPGLQAN